MHSQTSYFADIFGTRQNNERLRQQTWSQPSCCAACCGPSTYKVGHALLGLALSHAPLLFLLFA